MNNKTKLIITVSSIAAIIVIASFIFFIKSISSSNQKQVNTTETTIHSEIKEVNTTETTTNTEESTTESTEEKPKSKKDLTGVSDINKFSNNVSYSVKYMNSEDEFGSNQTAKLETEGLLSLFIYQHIYKEIEIGNLTENVKLKNDKTLKENADNMLIYSDNEAADLIIELLGLQNLNRAFKDYGYKNTELQRLYNYDEGRKKGLNNYTSSEDVIILLESVYKKEDLAGRELNKAMKEQKVNNKMISELPEGITAGNKTGDLNKIISEAAFVEAKTDPYIAVVIANDIKNLDEEQAAIKNLGKIIYEQSEK